MDAKQIIEYIDNRINFIENHCFVPYQRNDGKSNQHFIHNCLMQGRVEELKDLKKYFEEEVL